MSTRSGPAVVDRGAPPDTPAYRWVYLWHWPIRAMHWTAAVCIVVLAVTGLYIGRPYFMTGGEATPRYIMGWIRFAHFFAAGVLVMTAIIRAYWLIAGNKYERAPALFPVRRRDWVNFGRMMKYYLMIQPEKAPHYLGHHPLQQFSYTLIYMVAALQVVTGFTLYGLYNPSGLWYRLFGWVGPLFGGVQDVRFIHHVATWVFLIFIPIHIYLATRSDVMEREGTISSIFSGGRFVRADHHYEDE